LSNSHESTTPATDSPLDLQHEVEASFEEFELSFRKNYPVVWLLTLISPFVVGLVTIITLGLLFGYAYAQKILLNSLATFFLLGRFVIILGGHEHTVGSLNLSLLPPLQLLWMLTFMDVMVAMVVAFHIGFMFRIPLLGPRIKEMVADGNFILTSHPWMRRATMAGLVSFVAFPLSTTGSIGGAIFGRLLGLSRMTTLLGILTGSLLGNGLMFLLSGILKPYKDSPVVNYGGFVVIIAIIFFLERRYRAMKKQFLESRNSK